MKFSTMFLAVFSVSGILTTLLAIFDDGGTVFWKVFYLIPAFVELGILILDLFVVKGEFNLPTFLLKKLGYEKSVEIFEDVYEERTAKLMAKEFNSTIKKKRF